MMPERIWAEITFAGHRQIWWESGPANNCTGYIRADLYEALRKELQGFPHLADMRQCMVDTADENAKLKAEIERLTKALDQAIDAGSLAIETVNGDKGYGMWRYEGKTVIVGQSSTENFFAGHPCDNPELAAELEKRNV